MPADRAHADGHPVGAQFVGDAAGRPLALTPEPFDPGDYLDWICGGPMLRC